MNCNCKDYWPHGREEENKERDKGWQVDQWHLYLVVWLESTVK